MFFRPITKLIYNEYFGYHTISFHLSSETIDKMKFAGKKIRNYTKITKINNFVIKNYSSLIIVKI